MEKTVTLRLDGRTRTAHVDTRTTLLDLLRLHLSNTSPKSGCDHGQCGSCTVLVNGRRVLSCLGLAVAHQGADVVTAEGLGECEELDTVQQAFVDHDALQCGFCTPGQVCSAVGVLAELRAGHPSVRTGDLTRRADLSPEEVRERMSGNLCRCGAYPNIVDAIIEAGERP